MAVSLLKKKVKKLKTSGLIEMKKEVQPKIRNLLARNAWERNGAGYHGKKGQIRNRHERRKFKQMKLPN